MKFTERSWSEQTVWYPTHKECIVKWPFNTLSFFSPDAIVTESPSCSHTTGLMLLFSICVIFCLPYGIPFSKFQLWPYKSSVCHLPYAWIFVFMFFLMKHIHVHVCGSSRACYMICRPPNTSQREYFPGPGYGACSMHWLVSWTPSPASWGCIPCPSPTPT